MSDIGVSYDISYAPNPVGFNAKLSLDDVDVKVTMSDFPPVVVGLTPHYSADILTSMISTVGTPLVNGIALFLGAFAGQFINGKSFTVATIPDIPYTIQGTTVTLKPSKLVASELGGMLKISGDFAIS